MNESSQDLCELCCKTLHRDDDSVALNPIAEQLTPAGTYRAHRHCWQLACSLGSMHEARELLSPRTRSSSSIRVQPRSDGQRTITIKPARMLVNTMQVGALFPHLKRIPVLPA
jgi:hypothetical protein